MRQNRNVVVIMLAMATAMLLLLAGGLAWFLLYVEPMAGP